MQTIYVPDLYKDILDHLKIPMPDWCAQCAHLSNEENLRCRACFVQPTTKFGYTENGESKALVVHKIVKRPRFFELKKGADIEELGK